RVAQARGRAHGPGVARPHPRPHRTGPRGVPEIRRRSPVRDKNRLPEGRRRGHAAHPRRSRPRPERRQAGGHRVDLESGHLVVAPQDDLSAFDDALSRLAGEHPQLAELVQLRYFGGLTLAECAETLGVSARTADTWWAYARSWLAVELKRV